MRRPKVGVDGLYLRYSPTHVPAKQGKIGPIKSSAVILILEEQILCFVQWARMGHTKGISHSQPASKVQNMPYKIEITSRRWSTHAT